MGISRFTGSDNQNMNGPLRDLLKEVLKSNSPEIAVEAALHEHPDLPDAIGKSWANGFCTDHIPPAIAGFFVAHGAPLTVHAAAAFGFTDSLANLLAADPSLIYAKGGDGCTPLHFARDVATAQFLLDHGPDIDARDEDHNSTPAHRVPSALRNASACSTGSR